MKLIKQEANGSVNCIAFISPWSSVVVPTAEQTVRLNSAFELSSKGRKLGPYAFLNIILYIVSLKSVTMATVCLLQLVLQDKTIRSAGRLNNVKVGLSK
jgi:hypothetical protein